MKTFLLLICSAFLINAQVSPVLTRSGGNLRHGSYQETVITPANVNRLHRLYSITIPGDKRGMESQPLVLPGVVNKSDGKTYDLLVLSTMANDVMGCDLKTGKVLWRTNLGRPITPTRDAKGKNTIDFWDINDHWGILSTGVIDKDTQTWYGVTWSSPDGSQEKGWHSVHAVDLKTGQEPKKPLSMNPLTYISPTGRVERFAGQMRKQRSALTLLTVGGRKVVVFASGSVLETNGAASGWVSVVDLGAWRITASWASTSKYSGAGIWMAGQGLGADDKGNLYGITGNGSFFPPEDISESFFKLTYNPPADPFKGMGSFTLQDWWTAYTDSGRVGQDPTLPYPNYIPPKLSGTNRATSSGVLIEPVETVNADSTHHRQMMAPKSDPRYGAWSDQDLGSGSIILLPQLDYLGGAGKDGIWYAVKMSNMGKSQLKDFSNPAANYAKLWTPPIWFTYAAFKHVNGQVVGFEDTAPQDATKLDFTYDNMTHHMHSTPAVLENSSLGIVAYCHGENGNLRAWRINPNRTMTFLGNGQEIASPDSPRNRGGMPGGMLAVSSNNGKNAIVWDILPLGDANREVTGGKLIAYDATNLGKYPDGSGWIKTLWTSTVAFDHPKFGVPVITGGYVVLPTFDARVDVLGVN